MAKSSAALTAVLRHYNITSAAETFITDESMMNAAMLLSSCANHVCTTSLSRRRTDFVTPVVQSWTDAASLVACICADGLACRSLRSCAEALGN